MIISFEVKIVNRETIPYKYKNNLICLPPALFKARAANWLKKPNSSRIIDKIVIERKRIKIFIGLIEVSFVSPWYISKGDIYLKITKKHIPKEVTNQKVSNFILNNFTSGLNKTTLIKLMIVNNVMIYSPIILSPWYYYMTIWLFFKLSDYEDEFIK